MRQRRSRPAATTGDHNRPPAQPPDLLRERDLLQFTQTLSRSTVIHNEPQPTSGDQASRPAATTGDHSRPPATTQLPDPLRERDLLRFTIRQRAPSLCVLSLCVLSRCVLSRCVLSWCVLSLRVCGLGVCCLVRVLSCLCMCCLRVLSLKSSAASWIHCGLR